MRGGIEVFYDGGCRLCVASRHWAEARDRGRRLVFRDLTAPALQTAILLDRQALALEMTVRTEDGRLLKGFDGWLAVLGALPRWRWFALVLGAPPLRWIGPSVYRFVARHRRRLPWDMADGCTGPDCTGTGGAPH